MSINGFLGEIGIGIVASALFSMLWWTTLKPKLSIAPKIAFQFDPQDNQMHYSFKIINRSFFTARDIRIVIKRVKSVDKGGSMTWQSEELARGEILFIKGCKTRLSKGVVECVAIFSRAMDIEKSWTSEYHLEVVATSTHSLSGISGFVERQYHLPLNNSIVQGEHSNFADFVLIPVAKY
ncbi:MAG: hypothetical protein EON58_19860 [Alphaproteobacteria bacterium]|nr:MAG: hypothetical protein EON58_19860 [Alphaproteobacteria bacterium]